MAVLAGYVGHPDWLLRLHAAWALGALGGSDARRILDRAFEAEENADVQREIAAAQMAT